MKKKVLLFISIFILLTSITLELYEVYAQNGTYEISYEYVNIKDMASAKVAKKVDNSTIINHLFTGFPGTGAITPVDLPTNNKQVNEVTLPVVNNSAATEQKVIWHLPTEIGIVTQNPHYGHVALDITSPRGSQEIIFPVANGVVSSIYTDRAGAKIVTVLHNIDNQKYTSQYVHLSSYASGIYVGKEVTVNDALGFMGTTGNSTGVHLHLAVLDCALFDPNDSNCSNLNGFFRYGRARLSQGYIGLGTMMIVPGSWSSR